MKFGIEFEMGIYCNTIVLYDDFIIRCNKVGWKVDYDASVKQNDSIVYKYLLMRLHEIKTKPYEDLTSFLLDVDYVFRLNINSINCDSKNGLRFDFNYSTGMHIHFSNFNHDKRFTKTPELLYLREKHLIDAMRDYINDNCKYKGIKRDLIRRYAEKEWDDTRRYSCINTTNSKFFGTIEFRMFNLHDITTRSFKPALIHQITLMIKAILEAYKMLAIDDKIDKKYLENACLHSNRLLDDALKSKIKIKRYKYILKPEVIAKLKKRCEVKNEGGN